MLIRNQVRREFQRDHAIYIVEAQAPADHHLLDQAFRRIPLEGNAKDLCLYARRRVAPERQMVSQLFGATPDERRHVVDNEDLHDSSLATTWCFGAWMSPCRIRVLICDPFAISRQFGVFHAILGHFQPNNNETHNHYRINALIQLTSLYDIFMYPCSLQAEGGIRYR